MASTIALRFRDLSGPTIAGHNACIDDHGFTWWAWWSKPDEKIPREILAEFISRIEDEGHVSFFLADSGERKLYEAKVTGIEIAPGAGAIPSPQADATPPYYRTSQYKVWFKIENIDEVAVDVLAGYSYDEPPAETFDAGTHREAFHSKRVFDLDEILSWHRTMYFLRPSGQGDATHRVVLEPEQRPGPFETSTREVPSNYVLHLSDLHFGEEHGYAAGEPGIGQKLSVQIIQDLRAMFGPDTAPGAVIISGDFTWMGKADEFAKATEFIDDLQSAFKLHASRFVICPGNHDIQWGPEDEPYDAGAPVEQAPEAAEENYRRFARDALQLNFPESLAMGRRFLLENFVPVDVIAVNSSRLEQRHFRGYGYVSDEQLLGASAVMGWDRDKGGQLRILVLHHHVVPVVPLEDPAFEKPFSLTLDAAQVLFRALERKADLVLHGHMHQPFAASFSRSVRDTSIPLDRRLAIQAAGSAGVKANHIPPGMGRNSYCVYEIWPDRIEFRIRARQENTIAFADYWSYTLKRSSGIGLHP